MSHRIPFSLLHLQVTQNQIVPAAAPARAAAPPIPVTTTPAPVTTPTPVTKTANQQGKGEKRQAAASTTAAVTPNKKKKSKPDVLPGDCDHDNFYVFRDLSRGYFKKAYVHNKRNYPLHCSVCKLSFVDNPKEAFKGGNGIRACPNACNKRDHPCVHALCNGCWVKAREKAAENSPNKRATRGSARRI